MLLKQAMARLANNLAATYTTSWVKVRGTGRNNIEMQRAEASVVVSHVLCTAYRGGAFLITWLVTKGELIKQ
jgi:hypothetical protein